MKNNKSLEACLRDWDFELPPRLIARHPPPKRDGSRLLLIRTGRSIAAGPPLPGQIHIKEHSITDLPDLLQRGDLLVSNNTRVVRNRLELQRSTGGRIEALVLGSQHPSQPSILLALLKGQRKLKTGERLQAKSSDQPIAFEYLGSLDSDHKQPANALLIALNPNTNQAAWTTENEREHWFEQHGLMPLPPYLKRAANQQDLQRYQTVYASQSGSIAAPTAGLHLTRKLLSELNQAGVQRCDLNLQISYGTFAPLQDFHFQKNQLHMEHYQISPQSALVLNRQANQPKLRTIAIGTTSLRALESAWRHQADRLYKAGTYSTNLFLKPPEHPYSIDGLLTNFHLPRSSLFILVGSILGHDNLHRCYQTAIERSMRFYSYGDAMLILP